jgi:hypothetical protein
MCFFGFSISGCGAMGGMYLPSLTVSIHSFLSSFQRLRVVTFFFRQKKVTKEKAPAVPTPAKMAPAVLGTCRK